MVISAKKRKMLKKLKKLWNTLENEITKIDRRRKKLATQSAIAYNKMQKLKG